MCIFDFNVGLKIPHNNQLCHALKKMRAPLAVIWILTLTTTLTAQSAIDSLVLTKEQNDRWIFKLNENKNQTIRVYFILNLLPYLL